MRRRTRFTLSSLVMSLPVLASLARAVGRQARGPRWAWRAWDSLPCGGSNCGPNALRPCNLYFRKKAVPSGSRFQQPSATSRRI